MKVSELTASALFNLVCEADSEKEISQPFCCDLLSVAMSKAPTSAAWVTIMCNINTIAVATLTDCACVIIAEDISPDTAFIAKAKEEGISIYKTSMPIFEAALAVYNLQNASA